MNERSLSQRLMFHIYRVLFFFLVIALEAMAQNNVAITATAGITGPSYYTTLGTALDAINAGTHQGVITIQIAASTTEVSTSTLYQSGYNSTSNYSSIHIYPTASGLSVTGSFDGNALIILSGADNVTIDGRVNATGSTVNLIISNTSTAATSSTCGIRFIHSAENNIIQYCILKGSQTSASGIVFFSSSASGNGNDNNLIDHCEFTNAGARPYSCIYSAGISGSDNSNNTVSNCLFYDFFPLGQNAYGINMSSYNTTWTISGNSFFETTAIDPTASKSWFGIYFNNPSGSVNISRNYIGGSGAACTGTWTKLSSGNISFNGIWVLASNSLVSDIQGNTIKNFSWSQSASAPWIGIYTGSGAVNIGTTVGNIIGDTASTGSITYSTNTTGGYVFAIDVSSTGAVNVENNSIGSITATATNSANAAGIFGMYLPASGALTVLNNKIGSLSTPNCIYASSLSTSAAQNVYGIWSQASGSVTISGNTVANLTNATTNASTGVLGNVVGIQVNYGTSSIANNTITKLSIANANSSTSFTAAVCGIVNISGTSNAAQTVSGNRISSLSNTNTSFTGNVTGVYFNGPSTVGHTISSNFIYDLTHSSTSASAEINGIKTTGCVTTIANNILNLGTSFAGDCKIYGIYEAGTTGATFNCYYNTVYLGGTVSTSSASTYALYSAANLNTKNIKNNVFANMRFYSTGSTLHNNVYAPAATNITFDYNCYYSGNSAAFLNKLGATSFSTLATWKTAVSGDAHAQNVNPLFAVAGGNVDSNYTPASLFIGASGTGIITDYFGADRAAYSTVGAIIINAKINGWANGLSVYQFTTLKAAFDSINTGALSGAIILKINGSTMETASANLRESGYNGVSNYSSISIYPTVSSLSITGSLTAALIDLNGAANVTIDGRVNATGTTNDLLIVNTSTTSWAATLTFEFGASYNTVRYCTIKGSCQSTYYGIIYFGSASASSGNNYNVIDHCNITNAGTRPYMAIYLDGSSATYCNTGNTLSNNLIYDVLTTTTSGSVILIGDYTSGLTISGNSFYETTPLSFSSSFSHYILNLYSSTSSGYVISNNYIGGSQPQCGGSPWTITNSAASTFSAIRLFALAASSNAIQGNSIQNISMSSGGAGKFHGIDHYGGCATITNNMLGDSSGTGSIVVTNGATNGVIYGVYSYSSDTLDFENNCMGSITGATTSPSYGLPFYGLYFYYGSGTGIVKNNVIGSASAANSIYASSATTAAQPMYAVYSVKSGVTNVSGNTIANLTNAGISTTNYCTITGIYFFGNGTNTVSNNIIHDLTGYSVQTGTLGSGSESYEISVAGITLELSGGSNNQTVSGNTIYNLSNLSTTGTPGVIGIYFTSPVSMAGTVTGNTVHSLSLAATSTGGYIVGIRLGLGTNTVANNMVSLGGSVNTGNIIYGIYDPSPSNFTPGTNAVYFNSVSIGGTVSVPTASTAAMYRESYNSNSTYKNNLFFNGRSGGSSGSHYAIYLKWETTSKLILDYNDYYAPNGILAYYGSNRTTLAAFKSATGMDSHSLNTAIPFASNTDLHLVPGTHNLNGIPISGITIDFDGDLRNLTIPFMGADEISRTILLNLTALIEGFFDGTVSVPDTLKVYLHHTYSPYTAIDSAYIVPDAAGYAAITYSAATSDSTYYIVVKNRGSIETWSAAGIPFTGGTAVYNFTTAASKAYGTNQILKGSKYCIYSGDVNQDGFIDFSDLTDVDNDAYNFTSGYVVTDVNGDQYVDFTDLTIVDNNAYNFIGVVKPGLTKREGIKLKRGAALN